MRTVNTVLAFLPLMHACVSDASLLQIDEYEVAAADEETIVAWLKARAKPIGGAAGYSAFTDVFGAATVGAIGEENHAVHEAGVVRNGAFTQGLCSEAAVARDREGGPRWRALTLESGILEARIVDRYVHSPEDVEDLRSLLAEGFTHNMGPWQETKELVEWIRAYNRDAIIAGQKTIHVVGKDLPRTGDDLRAPIGILRESLQRVFGGEEELTRWEPAWSDLTKGAARQGAPMQVVLDAIERIDHDLRAAGKEGLEHPLAPDPDYLDIITSLGWESLSEKERQNIRDAVSRVAKRLADADTRQAFLDAGSGYANIDAADEYAFTLQVAQVAQQTVRNLDNRIAYPADPKALEFLPKLQGAYALAGQKMPEINPKRLVPMSPAAVAVYFRGRKSREQALADNVQWAAEQYGSLFSFAHNTHINRKDSGALIQGQLLENFAEGEFVAKALGRDYVVIAGTALTYDGGRQVPSIDECDTCVERLLRLVGDGSYLVDLRPDANTPAVVRTWLAATNRMRAAGSLQPVVLEQAYDAIYWYPTSSHARKLTR